MGVKGLQKYITSQPNAHVFWEKISIENEIERFQTNHGKKPKIVIDMKEMIQVNRRGPIGVYMGGQYFLHTRYLQSFLRHLKQINADIVFCFCGSKITNDVRLFIPKMETEYIRYFNLLNKFSEYDNLRTVRIDREECRLPITMEYNMFRLCRQYGEVRVNYARHNQEIGNYLKKNEKDILAVISNDTDFIAFDCDVQFWKADESEMRDMMISRVNRKPLLHELQLDIKQLQLVAAIVGGDFLPYENLKEFHAKLRNNNFSTSRLLHVVDYVRKQKFDSSAHDFQKMFDLKRIASDIFGESCSNYEMNAIENGLIAYDLSLEIRPETRGSIIRLMKEKNPFMYQLVSEEVFLVRDVMYADFLNPKSRKYTELILPLIRRMQGILFAHGNPKPSRRLVCMKHAHEEPFKVTSETIEYPKQNVPDLFGLIFTTKDSSADNARYELFTWMFGFEKNFSNKMRSFAKKYNKFIAVLVTIRYLLQNDVISADEADGLLLTEIFVRNLENFQPRADLPKKMNGHRVRIAHLYVKMFRWVCHAMEVCGLYSNTDLILFDGPYFHQKMDEFDGNPDVRAQQINAIRYDTDFFMSYK